MLSDEWLRRYELLKNLHYKGLMQCDRNVNVQVDFNSSPCVVPQRPLNDQSLDESTL